MKRSLKDLWHNLHHRAKRVEVLALASLSFMFGCATQSSAQTVPRAPTAIVDTMHQQTPVAQKPVVQKPVAHKPASTAPARLDVIKGMMRKTEAGKGLLQFAADNKINIRMSNSKSMDDDLKDGIFIEGLNHGTWIDLNRDEKSNQVLMFTLAHEIRHSWHQRVVKTGELENRLDPKHGWISDRVQEADCFAFEIHFGYEYQKATGKALDPAAREGGYGALATYYAGLRDGGMDAQKAYGLLVEKAFAHTHGLKYDDDFLDQQIKNWQEIIDHPVMGILHAKTWETPVSDADFAAAMKKITTVGTDVEKDSSGLSDWTDADFTNLDKTGGSAKGDMEKLDKAQKKYEEAKAAWENYLKTQTEKILEQQKAQKSPDIAATAPHRTQRPSPGMNGV